MGLVDLLPDDVLLAIFVFCAELEAWQPLVHVCRRWRIVVFGSPRRLDLQLVCSAKTSARKTLDIWPALPLVILCDIDHPIGNVDNIVAVLERSDRVRQIDLLGVSSLHLANGLAAMQEPFPELTHLMLSSNEETVPVLPDTFLGGSAPRLRIVYFGGIPFPGLPKLLLSATHLVYLSLFDIPHSGYFSPEAMVIALSMLISLESLSLEFQSLDLALIGEANIRLPRYASYSLFSQILSSKGSANTWTISWPVSTPLNSSSCISPSSIKSYSTHHNSSSSSVAHHG